MGTANLTAFWIKRPVANAPVGFGVTAWSLADALAIIRAMGYGHYLPKDLADVQITEGITTSSLDQAHVVPNMGPISVRGMWYPFAGVGIPAWGEERLRGR